MTPLAENTKVIRAVSPEVIGIKDYDLKSVARRIADGTGYDYRFNNLSDDAIKGLLGKTFDFNGLVSTSGALSGGRLLPTEKFGLRYPVWLELYAPKGTRAVKVPNSREREILFDKMRAVIVGTRMEKGKLIIEMAITGNL
jgi:hypothetical protein